MVYFAYMKTIKKNQPYMDPMGRVFHVFFLYVPKGVRSISLLETLNLQAETMVSPKRPLN